MVVLREIKSSTGITVIIEIAPFISSPPKPEPKDWTEAEYALIHIKGGIVTKFKPFHTDKNNSIKSIWHAVDDEFTKDLKKEGKDIKRMSVSTIIEEKIIG